ncbi:MAG: ISNCY family transposase, partial [Gammaproteobacteria bacterium]|nr:ISNCY family transposase [Gammaproteobacteria bacterium]
NQKDGSIEKKTESIQPKESSTSEKLRGRCDSFVLETNVHFPTDISLLFDAVRKSMTQSARLAETYGLSGWRQFKSAIKKFKKQYRKIQILKHSTSKDETKQLQRAEHIKAEYMNYIEMAEQRFNLSEQAVEQLKEIGIAEYE